MKYLKNTRQILKWAVFNGWVTVNLIQDFEIKYVDQNRPRLIMTDILKIYQKDFKIERLNEVRDVFIFSCFTGSSWGEVSRLTLKGCC